MPHVNFGTKNEPGFDLKLSDDLIAVRTRSHRSLQTRGAVVTPMEGQVSDGTLIASYPEAGVEPNRISFVLSSFSSSPYCRRCTFNSRRYRSASSWY